MNAILGLNNLALHDETISPQTREYLERTGGSVRMSVERTAQYEDQSTLCFRIRDTGIGIGKDFLPRIFDAFTQEDNTRKNKYGSTGLGLAITKNMVEMMNGTISVPSRSSRIICTRRLAN